MPARPLSDRDLSSTDSPASSTRSECLEQRVRETLEEGTREADYRLFGKKYDSLGSLLERVVASERAGKGDRVEQYVVTLVRRQLIREARSRPPRVLGEHRDAVKELDGLIEDAASLRASLAASGPEMPAFLDWFEKWFLRRAEAITDEGPVVIDLDAAGSSSISRGSASATAQEQLRGAVAIHNILRKHRVAYLADEVGMGKTYVALGALALFRHFDPSFRVLVIAPRENIQRKWQKELRNFTSNNVKVDDLRVRAPDGRPGRPLVNCGNLIDLVNEASLDPNRDFFLRMTSFSLPLGKSSDDWKRTRDGLRRHLPWLSDDAFDLRNKEQFKKNFARALCCALPKFVLVIVDEAHNFKHGFSTHSSARNRVLGEAFGRHPADDPPNPCLFPGYGPRTERVLLLSATPLEETYRHVWNQLDLFGLAGPFGDLKGDDVSEDQKKKVAGEFLVRRVTSIRVGGLEHTKNMYRREWRSGGVAKHDEPIRIEDERQRLVVALVQKKVSELLSGKRFNRPFQIGMLASFESFPETARLKRNDDDDEAPVFDDSEQTEVLVEREGMDVRDLNRLARDYSKTFNGRTLPHPKMDAVVDSLATAWITGAKALVFVRRVASVKELKRKLDGRYDDWLIPTLRARLPEPTRGKFDMLVRDYREWSRRRRRGSRARRTSSAQTSKVDDTGGTTPSSRGSSGARGEEACERSQHPGRFIRRAARTRRSSPTTM